jgi:dCTP deaminase
MLTSQQILELIQSGRLVVEPMAAQYQIGACSVDIRVGTQIQRGHSHASIERLNIGESVVIRPGEYLRCITLETLSFPDDVSGIVFLWAGFSRIGLLMTPTRIDPGWRGKLVLNMLNMSINPIRLSIGQRIASFSLFKLEREVLSPYRDFTKYIDYQLDMDIISPELSYDENTDTVFRAYRKGELDSLNLANTELRKKTLFVKEGAKETIKSLLNRVFEERDIQTKGRLLEDLIENLLSQIRGIKTIKKNARLKSEEIDIIVQNNVDDTFWKTLGNPLVVECKNWSSKVGTDEIGNLVVKMNALSPDVKTGILVAVNGISGNSYRDAQLRRREYRQKGIYIVVIERTDLERVAAGKVMSQVIEERYNELYLI